MKQKCSECIYLDKEKKMKYGKAYLYGCTFRENGYVTTWINTDNTLDLISCSDETEEDEAEVMEFYTSDQLPGQLSILDYEVMK